MSDLNIYTIGWICAVGTELVAATAFLDEKHDDPDQLPASDDNTYVLGRSGRHNVVIVALPLGQYGLINAAIVARDMARSFPNLRIGLMVGIGGGAPSSKHDIRLGDIVVNSPSQNTGGVLQYDYGKTIQDEGFIMTGHLNQSPQCLLRAIPVLNTQYRIDGHNINTEIDHVLERKPRLRAEYRKPDPSTDRLYESTYKHAGVKDQECTAICDSSYLISRLERSEEQDSPAIHYGTIASANQLMKDATVRDWFSAEKDVLCFEMEAAGLMNHIPCLVIRGICDYSDTHKNKVWQGYAAMAAAAYAKDLLRKMAPSKVEAEKKLTDVLSDMKTHLASMSTDLNRVESRVEVMHVDKHHENITGWLKAPDVSDNLNKALQDRHPGSGQRFIEGKAYQDWKTQPGSVLWLYGIPGCGKTILTSTVVKDLQVDPKCSPVVLYFYFDFTDTRKQQFEYTIRSLIDQLYCKNEGARKPLDLLYSSCENGKEQPSMDQLQTTFVQMTQQSGQAWIILDALDECTSRDTLLHWLRSLHNNETKIHLLVSSRPEQDIKSVIQQITNDGKRIHVDNDLIEADIRNYVHAQVREHSSFDTWKSRPDIQEEIETVLITKANGMFRWVQCQINALKGCYDPITLRKALALLPETLNETYNRILKNIPETHFDHTLRILQFLTYSERPLRLVEAVDAIAVEVKKDRTKGPCFDPQNRMPVPTHIVAYCSSLIVLTCKTKSGRDKSMIEEIQLAHFSVHDYLTSKGLEERVARNLQETSARTLIAEVCLTYLLELKDTPIKLVRQQFPFAQYSAQYWSTNAIIGEHNSEHVFELAQELLSSRDQFKTCCSLYNPNRPWEGDKDYEDDEDDDQSIISALCYASFHGLPRCVQLLLDNGADVNAQGGDYRTSLQAASANGHTEVARLLLDNGADVNAQDRYHGTALQAASANGHTEVVRLLLDNGAEVIPVQMPHNCS